MPRPRLTLLHGLLLLADSDIRVSLSQLSSIVNTLLVCLVLLRHWVAFRVVQMLAL
jgi:hypothetical protein